MKQPVRITFTGEDYAFVSTALLTLVDILKKEGKKPAAKRIVRALARAKKRPVVEADFIQQMRSDEYGEVLCYLGVLMVDGNIVPISGAKQRDSRLTAKRDACAALRRLKINLDKEWA
jgi:hypothetical protein